MCTASACARCESDVAVATMQDDTLVLDGYGDKTAIEARCEAIRQAVEESTSDYDKCASCHQLLCVLTTASSGGSLTLVRL